MQKKLSSLKLILILLLLVSEIIHGCVNEFGMSGHEVHASPRPTTRISAQKIHEIVKMRIASGIDLNLPMWEEIPKGNDNRYSSPLIVCCENPPYIETIELLLSKKANPNIFEGGCSPITLVCASLSSQSHLLALRLLIAARSEVHGHTFEAVRCLCENPQDEALLKNPGLRIEAMELLLKAKARIPYQYVLKALLKPISPKISASECQSLLQERKYLIRQVLRKNVSIFHKTNPDFFDIANQNKTNQYFSEEPLNDELIEYTRDHEEKRCRLNMARYRLFIDIESSRRKNMPSPFNILPKDAIKKVIFIAYPKIGEAE